jgi:5'-3' exonuclease
LKRYVHVEQIPHDPAEWDPEVRVRGAKAVAASLAQRRDEAMLYRELATLRLDVPLPETLEQLEWGGVLRQDFQEICWELGFDRLMDMPHRWAAE